MNWRSYCQIQKRASNFCWNRLIFLFLLHKIMNQAAIFGLNGQTWVGRKMDKTIRKRSRKKCVWLTSKVHIFSRIQKTCLTRLAFSCALFTINIVWDQNVFRSSSFERVYNNVCNKYIPFNQTDPNWTIGDHNGGGGRGAHISASILVGLTNSATQPAGRTY